MMRRAASVVASEARLARLALPLLRSSAADSDSSWFAQSIEEFDQLPARAVAQVLRQPVHVLVDGRLRQGQLPVIGDRWAAGVPMSDEGVDLEVTGHGWPMNGLTLVGIQDLEPYLTRPSYEIGTNSATPPTTLAKSFSGPSLTKPNSIRR